MTETTTRTWTEAPASANIKFTLNGFDTMLTLRGDSGADLLPKLEAAMDWLAKKGATPTSNGHRNGGSNGGNGQAETRVCPVHHTPMKLRRGKGGDAWYSHKAVDPDTGEEYWCRGEQK
jgi:hypothetical protein